MAKARTIALLKCPNHVKAVLLSPGRIRAKRAVDTEILIRKVQSQPADSQRYMQSIARKAGKTLDNLLHTLGTNAVEIFKIIDTSEWRKLGNVEKCAVGIFHQVLGEDVLIPYTPLRSFGTGWALW